MVPPRMTLTVQLVLRALLAEPGRKLYGYEVILGTGLASGTVYPILSRLEKAGWLKGERETISPQAEGRPPRKYYQLTAEGTRLARKAVAHGSVRLAALGVTQAPPQDAPLNVGGVKIPVITDDRQPPGTVSLVSAGTGRDAGLTADAAHRANVGADSPEANSNGPCEHRRPPGSYCRACDRLI